MAATIDNSRLKQKTNDQKLSDGITKHAATIVSLVIAGQSLKTADILAVLQARIDTANAVQTTRAGWLAAVKTARDEQAKTKAFASSLRQALGVAFAGSIDGLADFGLTPRKPVVVSPEKKVAAIAKAKATRAARHTMGKKQKQAIKGAVPQATPMTALSSASQGTVLGTAPPPAQMAVPTVPMVVTVQAAPVTAPAVTAAPAQPHLAT